jgi:hypothetical protein
LAARFVGRWKLIDAKGVTSSYLTVTESSAKRDHADALAKWVVAGHEARFFRSRQVPRRQEPWLSVSKRFAARRAGRLPGVPRPLVLAAAVSARRSRDDTGQAKHGPGTAHDPRHRRRLPLRGGRWLIIVSARPAGRSRQVIIVAAARTAGNRLVGESLIIVRSVFP